MADESAWMALVGQPNPSCRPFPADMQRYGKWRSTGALIDVETWALPRGSGMQLAAAVRHGRIVVSEPKLVHVRRKCAGFRQAPALADVEMRPNCLPTWPGRHLLECSCF
jgi:hypothetical protein